MEEQEDTGVQRMTTSPIIGGESIARNPTSPQEDQRSDNEEDSECSVMDSAFKTIPENFEDRIQLDINIKTFEDDEKDYIGDEWQWNSWGDHNIDTEIEGPRGMSNIQDPVV